MDAQPGTLLAFHGCEGKLFQGGICGTFEGITGSSELGHPGAKLSIQPGSGVGEPEASKSSFQLCFPQNLDVGAKAL